MTKYKQLCADLLDALIAHGQPDDAAVGCVEGLLARTRAALAEPEPQHRCIYNPVQIAECGGPCEQGPEHCDCGELWVTEPKSKKPTK